jgi:hypothetical protein
MGLDASVRCNCIKEDKARPHPFPELLAFDDHIVEPTRVTVGITMRDGALRSVTVIESTGWYPVASVWIQEWFDETMPNRFRVLGSRRPNAATVEFPASLPDDQRKKAFAVNTKRLVRLGGCKTAEAILPGISQLESAVSPD